MIPQTEKHKFGAVSLNQTLKEKVKCVISAPVVQFVVNYKPIQCSHTLSSSVQKLTNEKVLLSTVSNMHGYQMSGKSREKKWTSRSKESQRI